MEYKYDVAISCAEEDLPVAEQIASALKSKGVSYYLYTEHKAQHWGEHIFRISLDKYGAEAQFVLMLVSKFYIKKYWTGIEQQVAQTAGRIGGAYILPLRLDDSPVDGLGVGIIHQEWKDNPEEIAGLIAEKIREKNEAQKAENSSAGVTINHIENVKNKVSTYGNIETQNNQFIN